MPPDFTSRTVDNLGKRSRFLCSRPGCAVATVGPNSDPSKPTVLGEAAHIFGARPGTARYDVKMSDSARAEITNAIWLCRNCHAEIDKDERKYPAQLLFAWREEHERNVAQTLGQADDRMRFDLDSAKLREFAGYPPIVRRIVMDMPAGWEQRLTAELMRFLNRSVFRKLDDLRGGFYTLPSEYVGDDEAMRWILAQLNEMQKIPPTLVKLVERLTASWGKSGEVGDASEIHHTCRLIQSSLEQIIRHEEQLRFVDIDDDFHIIRDLLRDCLGSQAVKFKSLPDDLDKFVSSALSVGQEGAASPRVLEITIGMPPQWEQHMSIEIERLQHRFFGTSDFSPG